MSNIGQPVKEWQVEEAPVPQTPEKAKPEPAREIETPKREKKEIEVPV